MSRFIAPSIFAADFGALALSLEKAERQGCEYIHIDVMDGHFVPNISFGPKITADILSHTKLKGDVHLMVTDPVGFAEKFIPMNPAFITFHYEALHPHGGDSAVRLCAERIREAGVKAGLSIKPATKISEIVKFLDVVDLILIMSVEPGFSGQSFIAGSTDKIGELADIRKKGEYRFLIEIDGGIGPEMIPSLTKQGVDLFVMGSRFFE